MIYEFCLKSFLGKQIHQRKAMIPEITSWTAQAQTGTLLKMIGKFWINWVLSHIKGKISAYVAKH